MIYDSLKKRISFGKIAQAIESKTADDDRQKKIQRESIFNLIQKLKENAVKY